MLKFKSVTVRGVVIMNSVKILHCADIHIGAAESFLSTAERRKFERIITFERIIDKAKENSVQVIAIAGDLFDFNGVENGLADPVFEKIASVPEIKVIFAAGNHDPLTADSPFKTRLLPDNLYVLGTHDDCIAFDELKLRVYGKSFENVYMSGEERFSATPPDDDYINLMVIHGELKSDLNSQYNPITPKFVKSCKMDYIALGHVHKNTEIGRIGNTFFAYCGCPEGRGFDELGEKGVYMGEISKGSCELEFVPICKRRYIYEKIDITALTSSVDICGKILSALKEEYGAEFAENLYKIELTGLLPDDLSINLHEISSRISEEVYFAKIKDSTETKIDFEKLSGEITLKGLFVKNMLAKIDNSSEEEKELLNKALNLGLKAFNSEVEYNED